MTSLDLVMHSCATVVQIVQVFKLQIWLKSILVITLTVIVASSRRSVSQREIYLVLSRNYFSNITF